MIEFKGSQFERDIVLWGVRWYVVGPAKNPTTRINAGNVGRIAMAGIETMHRIRKGQLDGPKGQAASAANQFYSLAF